MQGEGDRASPRQGDGDKAKVKTGPRSPGAGQCPRGELGIAIHGLRGGSPAHGASLLPLCSPELPLEQPHPFSFPFPLEIRPQGSAETDANPQAGHSHCLHLSQCGLPAASLLLSLPWKGALLLVIITEKFSAERGGGRAVLKCMHTAWASQQMLA